MSTPLEICRELIEAIDGNAQWNRRFGRLSVFVEPDFIERLRAAVVAANDLEADTKPHAEPRTALNNSAPAPARKLAHPTCQAP
jgi:hypothetical protein